MTMVLFGVITMFLYHHSFADQRRQLHQPFFPMDSLPPAMTPQPQPQSQSQSQPQLPFSTAPSSFFFPSYRSPSPPSPTALTSFPANISSLLLPRAHSNSHRHVIAVAVSASLLSAALLVSLAALFLFFFRRRRHNSASRSDSLRLFPPQSATRSSEFLYLGTLVNSAATSKIGGLSSSPYHKLGSPELNPLPPLPKNNLYNDDEEFFSPRGSGDKRSFGSTTPSYPSPVMPPPPRPLPTQVSSSSSSSSSSSLPASSSLSEAAGPTPPPAPPPPPALPPSDNNNSDAKPKLKPLHWDKVRASSDRAMVWDHFKSSSFQLNEEMIESLFVANNSNTRRVLGSKNQNLVLDPKKSQNIAILLRALNVTVDEVCQGLLEGNSDTLGPELLESLLKMAPTKEEEWKLREYKDGSLGPADKFLKAVLEIPFAFKRVEALLYIANFDSEIDYLARSFATLEVACGELKNSRMLMKILEAVLKTGNRMNIGTNRGAAHAFKLDTLLKLVDVRGADGKTTLLHFVVQEIMRAEGLRLCVATKSETHHQSSSYWDDVEFRKLGLQVVSGLSGELSNVKKAATMDSDVLANEVAKLAGGIAKVAQVLKSNEQVPLKFSESMNGFLKKAEQEIGKLQAQERAALSLVREVTEYFHGNSGKEEAHRFRIFMVVRDFLSALDHVCKQVGKFNDRSRVGFRQFANPSFPGLDGRQII